MFEVAELAKTVGLFGFVLQAMNDRRARNEEYPLRRGDTVDCIKRCHEQEAFAKAHELDGVAFALRLLREMFEQVPAAPDPYLLDARAVHHIQGALTSFNFAVHSTLAGRKFLALSMREQALFEAPEPLFGALVEGAFPATPEDIAEAGNCLALGRYTASVFHLMRALESAMQVVANKLGATVADKDGKTLGWGVIAKNMKDKIDKMTGPEQVSWYRVQRELEVVNRAWRVPTAHPKQTYTEEGAEAVFEATKAFMRELAPLAS